MRVDLEKVKDARSEAKDRVDDGTRCGRSGYGKVWGVSGDSIAGQGAVQEATAPSPGESTKTDSSPCPLSCIFCLGPHKAKRRAGYWSAELEKAGEVVTPKVSRTAAPPRLACHVNTVAS